MDNNLRKNFAERRRGGIGVERSLWSDETWTTPRTRWCRFTIGNYVRSSSMTWSTSGNTGGQGNARDFRAGRGGLRQLARNGYGITGWSRTRSMETFQAPTKLCSNRRWDTGRISLASNSWRGSPRSILIIYCSPRGLAGEFANAERTFRFPKQNPFNPSSLLQL